MPFNSAITSGQKDSLRGTASVAPTYSAATFLSAVPNNNVFTAQVNVAPTGDSFAEFEYDGGSGVLADVLVGMTMLISKTNDRTVPFFAGRIRKVPDANTFFINETSANIEDDDFVFVLDDFRIWDKLVKYSAAAPIPDWDVSFRELLPVVYNLRSAYADLAVSSIYTISFAPLAVAATNGASISTWLWDVADGTITVGSTSTQNITATFPPGFRWIHLTVTDDGARAITRHIPVWSHDDTFLPTILETGETSVNGEVADGYSATIPAFAGVSSVLDNTLMVVWSDDIYNGSEEDIVNNIAFVGRLLSASDTVSYDDDGQEDAQVTYEIEGPLAQLGRLEIVSLTATNDSTPTAFFEIDTFTPWRAAVLFLSEMSTFLELHSLRFDSTADTFEALGLNAQGGDKLATVNDIAASVNAALQMNAAGEAEIVRNAAFLATAARDALTTVIDFTTEDIIAVGYDHSHILAVGSVRASGGAFNTTNSKEIIADSIAQGEAFDYPASKSQLSRQILAADATQPETESELNTRSGDEFARLQTPDTITVTHPDGYWWLTPALDQWYTFTLDGTETVSGITLTTATRWFLISISVVHDPEAGTKQVEATYAQETTGSPGQTIVIDSGALDLIFGFDLFFPTLPELTLPDLDLFPLNRGIPNIAAFNDDGNIYLGTKWTTTTQPFYTQLSMGLDGGDAFVRVEVDPGSPKYLSTGNNVNVWVVGQDKIYYLEDIFQVDGAMTTTVQHTFNVANITARSIHAQRSTAGKVVVCSNYHGNGSFRGVWATFTTDRGTTWTEVQVSSFRNGGDLDPALSAPGCYVSVKTDGLVLCSAWTADSTARDIFKSTDGGATWAADATRTLATSNMLANDLHVPWDDNDGESVFYITRNNSGIAAGGHILRLSGTTNIHPVSGSTTYGVLGPGRWTIDSYVFDRQKMIVVGRAGNEGAGVRSIWISLDAGANWTLKHGPTGSFPAYHFAGISGNDENIVYLAGKDGALGYSVDFCDTILDMSGNLVADFVGIGDFHFVVGG